MLFPTNSAQGAYINLDGKLGTFKLSQADGDATPIDATGLTFGLDIANARQGWLALSKGARDWQPIDAENQWGIKPSDEHKPGVELDIHCHEGAFGDEPVRAFSGASLAVTNFVAAAAKAAGDLSSVADTIPTLRVNAVHIKQLGKGSSVNVDFTMLPREKWMRRDAPPAVNAADEENWD